MAKIIELDSKIQDKIFWNQKNGQQAGFKIGFPALDELISFKEKRTSIIYGRPTDGKSQLLIQILCGLATKHNKKALIYSPETGDVDEIYMEIISCLTGKSFLSYSLNYKITEKELYNVIPYVKDMFKVVELDEKEFNLDSWLELTEEAIKDYDIFSSSADNWNDLDHAESNMISEYLKRNLVKWNRHAKKFNYHGFVIAHARNPQIVKGDEFPKPARVDEIDGGYAWYAKAMNMLLIHREYEEHAEGWRQSNVAEIHIKKLKKRAEGKKGICKLSFDVWQNCYYENRGERFYLPTPFNGINEVKEQSNNDIQPIEQAPF
jgi:hypothetical protein